MRRARASSEAGPPLPSRGGGPWARWAEAGAGAWVASLLYAALVAGTAEVAGPGARQLGDRALLGALAVGHLLAPAMAVSVALACVAWGLEALVSVWRSRRGRTRPPEGAAAQRRARVAALLALLGATLAQVADLTVYVGLYAWAHALLGLGCLGLLSLGARLLLRGSVRRELLSVAGALGVVAALSPVVVWPRTAGLLSLRPVVAVAPFRRATGLSHALGLATSLWDRDGDGFSPLFGAGDCDDERADVHPLQLDVPGDGVDQDCSGADAALPIQERAPRSRLSGSLRDRPPHILLLSYEALRADRLSVLGRPGPPLLPNLELLARQGVLFGNAYSSSCWTVPSMWSLLSGAAPRRVRWTPITIDARDRVFIPDRPPTAGLWNPGASRYVHPSPLRDRHVALPEVLRRVGYRSITAASYLRFRRGGDHRVLRRRGCAGGARHGGGPDSSRWADAHPGGDGAPGR